MISMSSHQVPLLFGENASLKTGIKAKQLGMNKAMVICDQGVKAAGVVDPILENLAAVGIETVLFDGVLPDPPEYMVEEAGRLAVAEKVDGIVAIGGGSSMDTAKGVNVLINNPPPIKQWATPAIPPGEPLPLIGIPTTAGTGSEVTEGAVITDTTAHKKIGLMCPHCFFSVAIVDPLLYAGLPLKATTACAFDAYTHSVDAICHSAPEVLATTFAKESIRLIHKHLPAVVADQKDREGREGLAYAATLGGYAINGAMCHLTHAVGHSLGTAFHLPHGLCCAICLPQILRLYAQWMPERLKIVAEAMGLALPADISDQELGRVTSERALSLMKEAGLPTLKEMGYTLEQVYEVVPMMAKDMTVAILPRIMPESAFREMVTEAYDQGGGK